MPIIWENLLVQWKEKQLNRKTDLDSNISYIVVNYLHDRGQVNLYAPQFPVSKKSNEIHVPFKMAL